MTQLSILDRVGPTEPPAREQCRQCKGAGVVHRWRQDAYGPPAFHTQVCICRFTAAGRLA